MPAPRVPDAILITQCLQNDFVRLIDRYEPLPNLLHVGFDEAQRLLGERTEEGPVHSLLRWAYAQPADQLALIHIRDWHNAADPEQKQHLDQFGPHCIMDTEGARFVFEPESESRHTIVNASGLNDFVDTNLEQVLSAYRGKKIRVGLVGVWTEAKITFLAYDLRTRYPEFDLAVASPLTASSSRHMHFVALDQLQNILGVRVFSSLGTFTEFLAGSIPDIQPLIPFKEGLLHIEGSGQISETDHRLLTYLFRDCKRVDLKSLDGGFSGNLVLKARSIDALGHPQVPTVIKIGPRDPIAQERMSFERIEEVLGNNAPRVVDFAELGDRGGIKYRYAAMLDGAVRVFQDQYQEVEADVVAGRRELNQETMQPLLSVLDVVFREQLGRLYQAAEPEKTDLLSYYEFSAKFAPGVRRRVTAILGSDPEKTEILPGLPASIVCDFYEKDLSRIRLSRSSTRLAYVHGDLNGRNIVIDPSNNVWIIDFFHAHRGHVLRDLLKLENDILYIFTKIETDAELSEAVRLSTILLDQPDLGIPPRKDDFKTNNPKLAMAWQTICHLRSMYPGLVETDREPMQMQIGLLRYAMHTLSFDECNGVQKKWALTSGAQLIQRIKKSIHMQNRLRIDFLRVPGLSGSIGMTILPGRRDRDRSLEEDLAVIQEEGVKAVLCLITENEFSQYGVPDLKTAYASAGFDAQYLPIADQTTPALEPMQNTLQWLDEHLQQGQKVLVHCAGGLGRSGLMAAAYLIVKRGLNANAAIDMVREVRGVRAIETRRQEEFLRSVDAWKTPAP